MGACYLFIAVYLFQLACTKAINNTRQSGNNDLRICNIQQLSYYHVSTVPEQAVFTYNQLGDPLTITVAKPRTGYPNRVFHYDRNNRLTEYIGLYEGGKSFEYFHSYQYDNSNRIIIDTVYIEGKLTPRPADYFDINIHYFAYDSQDRIIRDSVISLNLGYNEVFARYSYDAAGNRIGRTYDQGINIHRTNKVWMFIDRDYSVNSPFPGTSYNSHELPLTINSAGNFLDLNFDKATVEYLCY